MRKQVGVANFQQQSWIQKSFRTNSSENDKSFDIAYLFVLISCSTMCRLLDNLGGWKTNCFGQTDNVDHGGGCAPCNIKT